MGYVASSYDIASIICVLPVSYMAARAHKPLVIGLSESYKNDISFTKMSTVKMSSKSDHFGKKCYIIFENFEVSMENFKKYITFFSK